MVVRNVEQSPQNTLGDVLYAKKGKPLAPERDWVALVRSAAARDESALHALYARAHHVVFTLALRITRSREAAEEVTLDVFHNVWRRAADYDPANGTVLGWIMNEARSRAIDRLRFDQRKKRREPDGREAAEAQAGEDPNELLELRQQGRTLRVGIAALSQDERDVIESAFVQGLTHAEVATHLNEPLGTVKTRIRSALQKLRVAMREP